MAPEEKETKTGEKLIFRVKPRLLRLLGDQLIRDANLAVFELVKNAYDADATCCSVCLENPDNQEQARIVVRDDGSGMDDDVLKNAWMVIATDFRAEQREEKKRTPGFGRFPLGEKGLGRLSVHKLGRFVRLITRTKSGAEFVIEFDWDRLESAEDLARAAVRLTAREPEVFKGKQHGTQLEVSRLRETWARGELRRLHRAVNSLCSPFKGPNDFDVSLSAPGREDWLEGLFTATQARHCALYHDLSPHAIGKVEFDFWLFDRDPAVLKAVADDVKGLTDYLDENGGIRIISRRNSRLRFW
ncbi:MAG: ATP-binding protein [Opitutaceae bacterium]